MLGTASFKPCSGAARRSFHGGVTTLRPGPLQQRRVPSVQIVQAKQRKAEPNASAESLQGRLKAGITQTISSRRPGGKQGGSKDAPSAKKQDGFRIGTITLGGSGGFRKTDPNTVFVAGATGRLGCRVVLELLRNKKLKVRAGARDPEEARRLVKAATDYGILPADAARRLTVVPVDLEDEDSIAPAVGNAGRVVQAIGAAETKLFDFGAPKRIDGEAAIKLVNVAKDLGVQQYVMVTSLGTGKFGFPASLLNLFWGVLVFKKKAERALEASGIPYVIVRPGGMERPTDTYKRTHNVRLATRDKLFGGQVSRLQVAELIATAVTNPDVAQNKVLEVVAEEEAEGVPYLDLLTAHPADGEEAQQTQKASSQPTLGGAQQQAKQAVSQAAPEAVQSKASKAVSKGKQSLAEAAPGSSDTNSPEEQLKEAASTVKKSFFETAEDLDQEQQETRQKADAQAKQERSDRAKKNAELVAQQKVEREAQNKKQAEEDKRKQEQQAKKDAEAKAAADKKKKSESKPAPKAEPKKKTEAQAAPKAAPKEAPKAEPKKKVEAKAESSAASTPEAKKQAQRAAEGAKEAREWISNWREGKTKGSAKQATAKAASGAQQPASDLGQQLSNVFGGVKLPWQQGNGVSSKQQQAAPEKKSKAPATAAASGSADTIEQRQKEARKWINDWRARTLETKLPQDVGAKQK